ncbi:aminoglycoside phosphotransferase family protein [uncultured Eudoraea sp.]|uniref:phosphotransferase enzyme family protein n=1 Tax=uncultured Eudoraea sp. TaxID=1035614 RepID=UPI00262EE75A|nr:aminoglycoside phosphotransferase family protein [uncultured Eudoraea sp.]
MESNSPSAVLTHFSIEPKDYTIQPLRQGYINDTFTLLHDGVPSYILQRLNTKVFSNIDVLMQNIDHALPYLNDKNYYGISLIKTTDDQPYLKTNNSEYWRMLTMVPNSIAFNTTQDENIALEAGKIIAKFHSLLQEAPLDSFEDTIPGFHDLTLRKQEFKEALAGASSEKLTEAQKAILFAKSTLEEFRFYDPGKLPLRICHNDTKLNNILFDKENKRALCLIDLDTLMKGYFHFDFGDAVRTIVNTADEDEKDLSKITFNKRLFEAFIDGLSTNSDFLTEAEIQHLAFGVKFMPFIHGIRALTDYLKGNIYYKVTYETQNLDRCLSLFAFTKKAIEQMEYMQEAIKKRI